jgi:UDP-N-acetylmuramoyl-tripeptide--D-alanyl-D-alanine ligase
MATTIPANRASFVLSEIAAATGGKVVAGLADLRVTGVQTDSRKVAAGQLYVALRGEQHDGHAFLDQAASQGAVAVLVERADAAPAGLGAVVVPDARRALGELARLHRERWGGKLVAITGSAGKTTTKELCAAALRALGERVLSTVGNLNNDVGLPMTLFGLTSEHSVAVVEIGTSGPGEIAWLAHVAQPEVGVVTTVALAHSEKLGSLDAIADEKAALLRALPEHGVAIYAADSDVLRARSESFGARRTLSFGSAADADLRLLQSALQSDLGTSIEYAISGGASRRCELSLYGGGAALDALAALAVVLGLRADAPLTAAEAGLRTVAPLPGRMRPRKGAQDALIIDDTYNANPASMLASLQTLVELARVRGGRALAALADMAELGAHAQAEHERIGLAVVDLALTDVFFCGPAMAHAARTAREEVRRRRAKGPRVEHVDDPLACISNLTRVLGPRAALLVKGSRALAMERLVEALCLEEGDAA